MNIYFLVEGRKTEKKVYPKWLGHLIPELKQAEDAFSIGENQFYIFDGNGYPSILDNHLKNAVDDVNDIGRFQYFVMCIDADEVGPAYRRQEVEKFIKSKKITLNKNTEFVLIVQNRCIETWFLGNRKIYKRNPSGEKFKDYINFYNVSVDDPELMGKMNSFETHAQFHNSYLKEMFYERGTNYTKKKPGIVTNSDYLEQLIKRHNDTKHLITFQSFINFCSKLKEEIGKNAG